MQGFMDCTPDDDAAEQPVQLWVQLTFVVGQFVEGCTVLLRRVQVLGSMECVAQASIEHQCSFS